jgi:hypothetical protein
VSPEDDEVVKAAQPDNNTSASSHTNGKDLALQMFMICLPFFPCFLKRISQSIGKPEKLIRPSNHT